MLHASPHFLDIIAATLQPNTVVAASVKRVIRCSKCLCAMLVIALGIRRANSDSEAGSMRFSLTDKSSATGFDRTYVACNHDL